MDERSRSKDDSFADALNFKKYTKQVVNDTLFINKNALKM